MWIVKWVILFSQKKKKKTFSFEIYYYYLITNSITSTHLIINIYWTSLAAKAFSGCFSFKNVVDLQQFRIEFTRVNAFLALAFFFLNNWYILLTRYLKKVLEILTKKKKKEGIGENPKPYLNIFLFLFLIWLGKWEASGWRIYRCKSQVQLKRNVFNL